ncbi:MAG TPA: bifunctional 5,10-methylenetetrahydrofolate dehydrogenase/5,10-methenyltetrahydrofolate cyclohydrolase [Streptosporangiaceae bacterium]
MTAGPVTARALSGKEAAAMLNGQTSALVSRLSPAGTVPRLVIVSATDDASSAWYVRSIIRAAGRLDIECDVRDLGPGADAAAISGALSALSADPAVHGIILQTPLPPGLSAAELALAIDPAKDVDGASPVSLGRLSAGLKAFAPATAQAVLRLLDFHTIELSGRRAVIVGRSTVVGKPLAQLLLARNATVTICHSRTRDLPTVTAQAEVLVAAAGRPALIGAGYVGAGAVVIDVGTNPTSDGGLVGDVDASAVAPIAGALSPVPGGVGPVTTAQLLLNAASAAAAA